MTNDLKRLTLGLASAGLLTLYGCGGSSTAVGGDAAQIDVPITVIDGLIEKATVCLDKNNNSACDSGEPTGSTGADGKVTLKVDAADVGKYPVISIVEAGVAIDSDTGPVTTSFTMKAPADQTTVITPLTTLVHNLMESNPGTTSAAAAADIQTQTGITVSLFEDFSKGKTDAHKAAANVARMVVVTTQEQSNAVKDAVDDEGNAISKADLNNAIQKSIMLNLPKVMAALNDPTVQAALKTAQEKIDSTSGEAKKAAQAEKDAAFQTKAAEVVLANGLTKDSVAAVVATAGFGIRSLDFTDSRNYFVKISANTVAQGTPDANGLVRYTDQRYRSTDGVVATWSVQSRPERQSTLHFNGTAWVNCPINFENTSSVRDANGKSTYNWCDKRATGESTRVVVDVAEQTMVSVLKKALADGYTNLVIGDNSDAALQSKLGATKFPAGSKLLQQTSTDLTTAFAYGPGTDDVVQVETTAPCADNFAEANAANLEAMITKFSGENACIGTKRTVQTSSGPIDSGDRNEGWGATVVSFGNIGTAPANFTDNSATSFYTTNTRLRVAFGAKSGDGGTATYYSCQERYNGSTRNCDVIGTGTYAIATLSDARVLTFANLPTLFSGLTSKRVFVERGGKVFYGYKDDPLSYPGAGLNMTASKALMTQLSIPLVINPNAPLALTAASYQGTWDLRDPADPAEPGLTLVINRTGGYACKDPSTLEPYACSLTFSNATTGAFTLTDDTSTPSSTEIGTLNFMTGTGGGTFNDPSVPASGNFVAERR